MTVILDFRFAFGIILLIIQGFLAFPLLRHMLKSGHRAGFSLIGEMIWVVAAVGWMVYGFSTASPIIITSAVIAFISSLLITVMIWSTEKKEQVLATGVTVLTALFFVIFYIVGGLEGLSISLSIFGVVQFVPQFLKSVRQFRERQIALGVSHVAAFARSAYTFGWAVWAGILPLISATEVKIDWPLVTWGLAGAVTFLLQGYVSKKNNL